MPPIATCCGIISLTCTPTLSACGSAGRGCPVQQSAPGGGICTPYPIPMSNTPGRFAVPPQCRFCETLGSVGLETTIHGRAVGLTWCCRSCGRDWPVLPQEQVKTGRRGGPADRRRATRAEPRAS